MEVTSGKSPSDGSSFVMAKFTDTALIDRSLATEIFSRIAAMIAERYVEEHFAEIVAKLDQNAIANLAVADAAKKIAEEIRMRPEIIRETRTQVYQRGLFGGLRRIL
jgi:hypothetical protein